VASTPRIMAGQKKMDIRTVLLTPRTSIIVGHHSPSTPVGRVREKPPCKNISCGVYLRAIRSGVTQRAIGRPYEPESNLNGVSRTDRSTPPALIARRALTKPLKII